MRDREPVKKSSTDDIQEGIKLLDRLREPFKGIPPEQIERDVREIVAEVHREQREKPVDRA